MTIIFFVLLGVLMSALTWYLSYPAIRNRRLMQGNLDVAQIRNVRRGAVTHKRGDRRSPQMHFELEVYRDGVLSHHVRASRQIPEAILAMTLPGSWVEIRSPYRARRAGDDQYPADGPKEWAAIAAFGVRHDLRRHVPAEHQNKIPNEQAYAELVPERFTYSAPIMATLGISIGLYGAIAAINYSEKLNYGGAVCEKATLCCEALLNNQPKIESRHCRNVKPDGSKGSCMAALSNLEIVGKENDIDCDPVEPENIKPPFPINLIMKYMQNTPTHQ